MRSTKTARRRNRLGTRPDWTEAMIEEAVFDAQVLRQTIPLLIDTELFSPEEAAAKILAWLMQ